MFPSCRWPRPLSFFTCDSHARRTAVAELLSSPQIFAIHFLCSSPQFWVFQLCPLPRPASTVVLLTSKAKILLCLVLYANIKHGSNARAFFISIDSSRASKSHQMQITNVLFEQTLEDRAVDTVIISYISRTILHEFGAA